MSIHYPRKGARWWPHEQGAYDWKTYQTNLNPYMTYDIDHGYYNIGFTTARHETPPNKSIREPPKQTKGPKFPWPH